MSIRCFLAAAAVAVAVLPLRAQCGGCVEPSRDDRALRLAETAGINAALGGLTGGTLASLRGDSFLRGFAQGAAGGGVTYLGKHIAVGRWAGAGLVGRQVAAVGSSITANAAEGRGALERVILPLGPVRLYLAADSGRALRPRLDAAGLVSAIGYAVETGARLDAGASLSDGTLVFEQPAEFGTGWGRHRAGIISYRRADVGETVRLPADVRAHERVHMIQHDQSFILWGRPLERAILGLTRPTAAVGEWVDPGTNVLLTALASAAIEATSRPWEHEAYLISDTRQPHDDGGGITPAN